jgi:cyclin-dependent kinase 12/13
MVSITKDLPMPPGMLPGAILEAASALNRRKIMKPRIIHRRKELPDWGDRCIDSFEVLSQIGEGTYGQVYKARDNIRSKFI